LDNKGPLLRTRDGLRSYLVAIDHFSKIAIVLPISKISNQPAIHFIKKVFECLGLHDKILLDSASYSRTKHIANWARDKDKEVHIPITTHSKANGCCEKFI
jgi:hypothetical protein